MFIIYSLRFLEIIQIIQIVIKVVYINFIFTNITLQIYLEFTIYIYHKVPKVFLYINLIFIVNINYDNWLLQYTKILAQSNLNILKYVNTKVFVLIYIYIKIDNAHSKKFYNKSIYIFKIQILITAHQPVYELTLPVDLMPFIMHMKVMIQATSNTTTSSN